MLPLDKDLKTPKDDLDDFASTTIRVLNYLPNVLSDKKEKGDYYIYTSNIAGTEKYLRPINRTLVLFSEKEFSEKYQKFRQIITSLKKGKREGFKWNDFEVVDKTLYTIQQITGAGLDLLVNPNSARKHVGNRFEELMRVIFRDSGISNRRLVLKIPYETEEGKKVYKCENDLVLSPFQEVRSSSTSLNENEIVVAAKTTSKDRMGKMFIDKMLLERFVGHKQKVIGIFLNDVQRKEKDNIGYTLVSGLFMVYTKFLIKLDGIYYFDLPPNALKEPYKQHMKSFSHLLLSDVWNMLSS
jgi:hypothetical protein